MKIKFEENNKRAAIIDNENIIGYCTYEDSGSSWVITHTVVNSDYQGQGLAKKILECVIDEAEKRGIDIIPVCSYAVRYFEKKNGK
ncbi:MAG: N-acetyltransferase [Eubacterium sp.]|nr:N-acetyltransferase [Eubacterium sp.]